MSERIQFQSDSESQTMALAATFAKRLRRGDVIALDGPLGSGKTCFVRGLAHGFGLNPSRVSSPTFVLCQEYSSPKPDAPTLVHIDAYRMSGPDELETIGWHEFLRDPNVIIAVEWPSRIKSALPAKRIDVEFMHAGPHTRVITMAAPPELTDRLADMAAQARSHQLQEPHAPAESVSANRCSICGHPVDPSSPSFPFCSPRCKLADLGRWFSGGYRVSRAAEWDETTDESNEHG